MYITFAMIINISLIMYLEQNQKCALFNDF